MPASTFNFAAEQGATLAHLFTWYSEAPSAGSPEGVPVDLTGATARMQVRAKVTSPDVLHSFTTENGGIVLGGASGDITIKATATQTATWNFTRGVYDLEVVAADGTVTRLLKGNFVVDPEVTR